jgi:hypothetical protein
MGEQEGGSNEEEEDGGSDADTAEVALEGRHRRRSSEGTAAAGGSGGRRLQSAVVRAEYRRLDDGRHGRVSGASFAACPVCCACLNAAESMHVCFVSLA